MVIESHLFRCCSNIPELAAKKKKFPESQEMESNIFLLPIFLYSKWNSDIGILFIIVVRALRISVLQLRN